MAMNKSEQARMENLEKALRLARALRWPDYPMPAPMTKDEIEAAKVQGGIKYGSPQMVALGWFANSYDGGKVIQGCSDGINQGHGNTTSAQGMGRLFATEIEAWQAIRHEITEKYAEALSRIDAEIDRLRS